MAVGIIDKSAVIAPVTMGDVLHTDTGQYCQLSVRFCTCTYVAVFVIAANQLLSLWPLVLYFNI